MMEGFSKVPRYLLRDGLQPLGPSIAFDPALGPTDVAPIVIYGFSDKPQYDAFLSQSPDLLTPYPLVKGYLQNQLDARPDGLRLVVLDASGPTQFALDATTMQHIIQALTRKLDLVEVSHTLTLDEPRVEYRVNRVFSAENDKIAL